MRSIKMVDLQAQYARLSSEIDQAMKQVLIQADFIQGSAVKAFESALAERYQVKHVISCANGTDALQLAFMALDLPKGSEVITPAFSYAAVAEVLLLLELQPVFVEVDPATFLMDVSLVEALITENTRAIAPVHLYGQMVSMEPLLALAKKHNLYVVEDAAQAIGSQYCTPGEHGFAGTMGHIGTTSFFPSKNLGCFGDGGAIFTNDDDLAQRLRSMANHGQTVKYQHDIIGLNSRLDTLQAAVLMAKLPHLHDFEKSRRAVAARYDEAFGALDGLEIPDRTVDSSHVFHQYTITCESSAMRDALKSYLSDQGIPSMIYYPRPLFLQTAYKQVVSLPISEDLCNRVLSLPICPELDIEQQNYIILNIRNFIQKSQ
ncbi:MAG: DegT/DnrJ/EryC1/StrS family aminotransferase [Bacteroidetes bacterium]|nr:DegT/DnrJ/EryC1/StrS family aminotransferase [Bacteroidota bacterium]MDA1223890.1 DegT/DnrJ/EryC1/StrS family aminotransferase [Bacteroidota bacterium]